MQKPGHKTLQDQTILSLVGLGCTPAELGPILEQAREVSAHVAILLAAAAPQFPVSAYGAAPYGPFVVPDHWQEEYSERAAVVRDKAEKLEEELARHDVSGDVATVYGDAVELENVVARRAMTCDLAYVGNDLRDDPVVFDRVLRALLFSAPVGTVLNRMPGADPLSARSVMIAWNSGLEASRAVHAALPFLMAAEQVTIACFDPVRREDLDGVNPGSDLAKWLSHRGCTVTVQEYPSGDRDIGTCIMERAAEAGTDLLVMGAYGHARLREAVFGGTTKSLVEQTKLAVLMSH